MSQTVSLRKLNNRPNYCKMPSALSYLRDVVLSGNGGGNETPMASPWRERGGGCELADGHAISKSTSIIRAMQGMRPTPHADPHPSRVTCLGSHGIVDRAERLWTGIVHVCRALVSIVSMSSDLQAPWCHEPMQLSHPCHEDYCRAVN